MQVKGKGHMRHRQIDPGEEDGKEKGAPCTRVTAHTSVEDVSTFFLQVRGEGEVK